MNDRHFSAAELAAHAGIPLRTITFFVNQGILEPSVRRAPGRGRGHVFDFGDLLAAATLSAVRLPNASAAPLRQLVRFWHTAAGVRLTEALCRTNREDEPQILLITLEGVELNATPADVMKSHRSPVVYCLDATYFFKRLAFSAGGHPGAFHCSEPDGRAGHER
jgi:hypothetical protein